MENWTKPWPVQENCSKIGRRRKGKNEGKPIGNFLSTLHIDNNLNRRGYVKKITHEENAFSLNDTIFFKFIR